MIDDDPTPDERTMLDTLPRSADPPAHLEERVVRALRAEGVLARRAPFRAPLLLAAAAALFFAGLAAGRLRPAPPRSSASRFVLLVVGEGGSAADEPRRVAEYRAWARSLGTPGTIVLGDRLAPEARLLDGRGGRVTESAAADAPIAELGGLFVVEAGSWDQAMALARTCPHLRHGGRLVVRRVAT